MVHIFDVDIAKEHGLVQAIVLNNLWYWIDKNRANETNYHDGYYWTYNSTRAYSKIFPYLSERRIYNALKDLEEKGIIHTGNYNQLSYDRTKWYAFTQKGECIMQKCKMDHVKKENASDENTGPIPVVTTNNKTNSKTIDDFFEICWSFYPNKKGKGTIRPARKKMAHELGEEFIRCINRFALDHRETQKEFIMQGPRFWNGGYVDYLDKNYKGPQIKKGNKKNTVNDGVLSHNYNEKDYDDILDAMEEM